MLSLSSSIPDAVPHRRLLAVLANPPLATSGERTRSRVAMAAQILGCDEFVMGNLFAQASRDVTDLAAAGASDTGWNIARCELTKEISEADDVLVGWGCSEPGGAARIFHRGQVAWLQDTLRARSARVWSVGGTPRHPSRWQRYTSRSYPGLPFRAALTLSLTLSNHSAASEIEGADNRAGDRKIPTKKLAGECDSAAELGVSDT